jgi:P4 family phage/plasmid primase-like protien
LEGAADVLIPHNTRWFSLVALDYPYEGTRSCPGWIAFLKVVLEGDEARIALLQEWFGYLLTHDTSQQKFLVVVGEGANGKSVVLTVLTALLGHENVSHVPLEMFGDKFQLSRTLGKLANIAPEVGELDRVAEGQLKALASGDRQHFDRKFQDAIEAQPTARFVFSTNSLPRFADRSEGIWRRLSIIPFQVSVPPERQDPRLADSLTAELPGIFSWAVEGLRRLRSNGRFTEPAVSVRVREEHRTESNFARAFLTEETVFRPGAQTPCATLYAAYKFRCEVEGRRALDAGQFGKEVPRTHPKVIKRRPAGGPASRQYVYLNLAMRSDPVPVVPPSGPRLLRRVV